MRIRDPSLQTQILQIAREEILRNGGAFHMRSIAKACGVSLGTLYNYYDSKESILLAVAVVFWKTALFEIQALSLVSSFSENVAIIYAFLQSKMQDFRLDLLPALREEGKRSLKEGKSTEQSFLIKISHFFCQLLEKDTMVSTTIWTTAFTKESFCQFLVEHLFLSLSERKERIDFLLEVVERLLYREEKERK